MRKSSSNPPTNIIPSNIDEADLVRAVETSGYPLQGVVAEKLEKLEFKVTEEWGFIDSDSQQHRSLDIFAYKILHGDGKDPISPRVALLIECKRTIHPYVFFKAISESKIFTFPVVAGVAGAGVELEQRDGKMSMSASGQRVLGLDQLPFVNSVPRCASFSKALPSGKRVELSGADPFNGIVLPLVKALEYANKMYKPHGNVRVDPTLLLCMCVLDAPMVLVESPTKASDPVLTPWVRITRIQASLEPHRNPYKFHAIDMIHIDSLESIMVNHVTPFTEEFTNRALRLGAIWKSGGVVESLAGWEWDQIKVKPAKK